jgi:hypothetical protein
MTQHFHAVAQFLVSSACLITINLKLSSSPVIFLQNT